MSTDLWRWVIAIAVFAHGIGHSLFMPLPFDKYPTSGHSWLLSGLIGDGPAKAVAYVLAGVVIAIFVAATFGFMNHATWWRTAAVVAAVISLVEITVFFDGLPLSNALLAVAFDVAVLAAIWANWPAEVLGS